MGIPAGMGVAASGLPPAGDQANAVLNGSITAIGPTQPFAFRGPMNILFYATVNTSLTTTNGSTPASVTSGTGLAVGQSINSINVPAGTTWKTFSGTSGTLAFPPITLSGRRNVSLSQITHLGSTAGLVGATVTGPGIASGTTVLSVATAAVAPSANSMGVKGAVVLSAPPTSNATLPASEQFTFAPTGNAVTTGVDSAAIFTGAAITFSATIQIERSFDGGATWVICNIGGSGTLAQYTGGTPISLTFGEPECNVLYRLNCTAYTSGPIAFRISQTGGAATSLSIGTLI